MEKIETVLEKVLKEQKYQIQTLAGVHTVTASALITHIGDIGRFRNANKLASYAEVAPICLSSAGKEKMYRIRNKVIKKCMKCYIF